MRRSLLSELKRRNVLRSSVLYAGMAWAMSQGIAQLGPAFGAAEWTTRWFVIACVVGFPVWVSVSWFFEFTPHGFKRDESIADDSPLRQSNARRLDFAIIAVLIVAVALLASGYFVNRNGVNQSAMPGAPAKSIAVLPFANLSRDKDNEYFVAGMQDLILTKLAEVRDLKVIARSSTAKYESQPADIREVGRELGVATILEGSVQRLGNEVLINVQLIDTQSSAHIWAQAYTRELDNIFGVEGEVAEKIAVALRAQLSSAESAQLAAIPTTSRVAYDLFLRAEHEANLGFSGYDTAHLKGAMGLYRQAVANDPNFGLAHARLSQVESTLAWFGGGGADIATLNQQAGADAAKALQLSPGLVAAHLALGYSEYYGKADYAAALKAFDAALALSPSDAFALAARGYVERRQGRFDAALASLQQALAHDPRNSTLTFDVGATCMMLSRYVDAERWFADALALNPGNINARVMRAKAIMLRSGDLERSLAGIQGEAPQLRLARVGVLTLQRRYRDAAALLQAVPDTPDNFPPNSDSRALGLARLHQLAGDAQSARNLFELALAHGRAQLDQPESLNLAAALGSVASAEIGLDNVPAALAAIAKSNAIITEAADKVYGPDMFVANAMRYAEAGRADLAVPLLTASLATPGVGFGYSPVMLWLDPSWDKVRRDPGFQALLEKYASYKPRVATAVTSIPG
jgi:TolB-like protein/Tfp pilus assembly protein PilF